LQNTFLSFEEVQRNRYPAFYIAYEIADNYAKRTAYNSADEIAVEAFLQQRIRFLDIPKVLMRVVQETEGQPRDLVDLIEIHEASRRRASEVIECLSFTSF
ncbi:MAG: 1-deoxy-D-xylulose-5-phosphate reductoisomerase, partial [Thermotogae bacterium]